jgi:hypothetical protein
VWLIAASDAAPPWSSVPATDEVETISPWADWQASRKTRGTRRSLMRSGQLLAVNRLVAPPDELPEVVGMLEHQRPEPPAATRVVAPRAVEDAVATEVDEVVGLAILLGRSSSALRAAYVGGLRMHSSASSPSGARA